MEPVQFGRYTLISRVAVGGMAEVFLARDDTPPDGRLVVVKRVLPAFAADPEFRTLFKEEMRIAASLAHRNIVPLHDAGEVDGEPFLTLEYVRGRDLAALLSAEAAEGSAVPPIHAATIGAEVCEALAFAHPRGVIHRDVSPANVLLSDAGEVKLADFGIARVADSVPLTRPDARRGKAGYLSPEQAEGRKLDSRSDLFGVGILLWEMLTGQRLFRSDADHDAITAVKTVDPAPPSSIRDDVPAHLDAIVLKALQRDPDARYQTAEEMGVELGRVVAELKPTYRPRDLARYLRKRAPWREPGESGSARSGSTRRLQPGEESAVELASPPTTLGRGEVRPHRGLWIGLLVVLLVAVGSVVAPRLWDNEQPTPTATSSATASEVASASAVASATATEATPPVTASVAPPTRAPTPTPPPTTKVQVHTPPPHKPVPVPGTLRVTVTPANAHLSVDGKRLGGTSPWETKISAGKGSVIVRAEATGYRTEERSVAIVGGAISPVNIVLKSIQGRLTLNTIPYYAEVYYEGERIGSTPLVNKDWPAGEHTFRLVNPTYHTEKTVNVTVREGELTKKIIDMAK